MADRILLVEDDPNLGVILQEHLSMNGYDAVLCVDGEEGLKTWRAGGFDLCLVDIMMPRMDGFSLVKKIRAEDQQTPIIFLTARSLKEDRITGFQLGCDDYITKPFSVEELLLRIEAVLRRSRIGRDSDVMLFQIGKFEFDANRRLLRLGNRETRLTQKESELLHLLAKYVNRTLPRQKALREIWQDEGYFSGRSMDVYVSKLRKHLRGDPAIEILSIHGEGIRLTVSGD
ncbi:MAG TPA: response regulator transcription factor [candidate division Zixibacteria bacterium]|nr:response regulator transcription factor [candidate division Zixibacteria bacterium]